MISVRDVNIGNEIGAVVQFLQFVHDVQLFQALSRANSVWVPCVCCDASAEVS